MSAIHSFAAVLVLIFCVDAAYAQAKPIHDTGFTTNGDANRNPTVCETSASTTQDTPPAPYSTKGYS